MVVYATHAAAEMDVLIAGLIDHFLIHEQHTREINSNSITELDMTFKEVCLEGSHYVDVVCFMVIQ